MQSELIVGDTLNFLTTVTDYPASAGWTLSFRLVPRGAGSAISFTATAEGDDYRVNVSAATTAAWIAGEYAWGAYVTLTTTRYTVDNGVITLKPDPSAVAAGTDQRTHEQKMLAQIRALLEGRTLADVDEYTINGRSLRKMSVTTLREMESYYSNKVNRAQLRRLGINPTTMQVRFGRA